MTEALYWTLGIGGVTAIVLLPAELFFAGMWWALVQNQWEEWFAK